MVQHAIHSKYVQSRTYVFKTLFALTNLYIFFFKKRRGWQPTKRWKHA